MTYNLILNESTLSLTCSHMNWTIKSNEDMGQLHLMKLSSSIQLGSLIIPIFFIFFYDHSNTSDSNSGHGWKILVCASSKYEGSPCVSASTDRRMRQYRSPDALVQIAGYASTDHWMRQYRSPDAQCSGQKCFRKG